MNKLMVLVVVLILTGCASTEMKPYEPAKQSSIENVIEMRGFTKEQIFASTKSWIAENFHSAKAVIENEDREAGTVIGNTQVEYICNQNAFLCSGLRGYMFGFTMRVDIKDQKFKVTLSNMSVYSPPSGVGTPFFKLGTSRPLWEHEYVANAEPTLTRISKGLHDSIEREKAKANW